MAPHHEGKPHDVPLITTKEGSGQVEADIASPAAEARGSTLDFLGSRCFDNNPSRSALAGGSNTSAANDAPAHGARRAEVRAGAYETSALGQMRTSAHPSARSALLPILLQKSFWGGERKFLEPLMRFTRGDVRDHIVSSKIDHGPP